ncbi:MAG: hypothetical protein ACE1ZS_07905 [Candidatus Poribacteria bacterium]
MRAIHQKGNPDNEGVGEAVNEGVGEAVNEGVEEVVNEGVGEVVNHLAVEKKAKPVQVITVSSRACDTKSQSKDD